VDAIAIEDVADWMRFKRRGRSEVTLRADRPLLHGEMFLEAIDRLTDDFGEPDFPPEGAIDWRQVLGLRSDLVAVWDFDYYQVSLRVESGNEGVVVLATHRE